ncbi:restriction endonuclease subunit S, partial [Helicobacter sp. 12S02232-10]|uniref:restriction endonuclease subunit S n=1 Tax=Helicobacter sp. 12S02232-10 TaxID=1476197 RepID=UPI00117BAB2C
KFIFYVLKNHQNEFQKHLYGASMPKLDKNYLWTLPIPIPPIEVQNEIVGILDRFDALCNDLCIGLPAEINARQKQYEYYRDQLLAFKKND